MVGGRLQFEPSCNTIPPQLTIMQILDLMALDNGVGAQAQVDIIAYTRVRRIAVAENLWDNGAWCTEDDVHSQFRGNRFSGPLMLHPLLQFLRSTEGLELQGRTLSHLRD